MFEFVFDEKQVRLQGEHAKYPPQWIKHVNISSTLKIRFKAWLIILFNGFFLVVTFLCS